MVVSLPFLVLQHVAGWIFERAFEDRTIDVQFCSNSEPRPEAFGHHILIPPAEISSDGAEGPPH